MRLYLIRHGKAERSSDSGLDEDRLLAPRGHRQAVWLGETLLAVERPPVRIVASPAARAATTASLIAEALGLAVEFSDAVGLSTHASRVVELLAEASSGEPLALVGHNPTLSVVAETLVRGPGASGGIELRTGEAAVLDLDEPADPLGTATLVDMLRLAD